MTEIFKNSWAQLLNDELDKDYYKTLREFLLEEYKSKVIYPNPYDIYNALNYTD